MARACLGEGKQQFAFAAGIAAGVELFSAVEVRLSGSHPLEPNTLHFAT
jgi:hypothetical protein